MYKSVIYIREDVPKDLLNKLSEMADRAFDNRVGKAANISEDPYCFSFTGGEDLFGCLELGMLELEEQKDFLACVEAWKWIDEDNPGENSDILAEMMTSVR